tara:strand:- start:3752 stop:4195 length:444 start_codon:yes stop_codon:yes gene_type:complete
MNNFFNRLESREANLIILSMFILFIFLVGLGASNTYNKYSFSVKSLAKEKADYDYVYSKASALNYEESTKDINLKLLDSIIALNQFKDIEPLDLINTELGVEIVFTTSNIRTSINFIEQVSNKTNLQVYNIDYLNKNQAIQVKFNLK